MGQNQSHVEIFSYGVKYSFKATFSASNSWKLEVNIMSASKVIEF